MNDVLFKAKLLSVVKKLINYDINELKNYVDQNLNKIPQINEIISSPRDPGVKGDPGVRGEKGRGIQRTSIVENNLVIQYDDGEFVNLGKVVFETPKVIVREKSVDGLVGSEGPKGDKGDPGNGESSFTSANIFNEDLLLFKDDGTNINVGKVVGPRGGKGEPGVIGEQGQRGLVGAMGPRGERGNDGVAGEDGVDGINGIDGIDGKPGPKGERGEQGYSGLDGKQGVKGEKGERGERGDPGSSADVAPLEKKFIDLTKALDTKISNISYNASMRALGTSSGSGEVNLRSLDDVDYNSVRSPTNGQVLIYNQTLKKWQANTAGAGNGDVTTAQLNSALANTNSFIKSQLANTNTYIDSKLTKTNPSISGTLSVGGTASLTTLILTNVLGTQYGGTGLSSFTSNAVMISTGASTLAFVTGTSGKVLQISANGSPIFDALDCGVYT
jgi:hypothetical protein